MFKYKVVLEKVVDEIPNAAQLLPKRYKDDKAKIAAHTSKCNVVKQQISNLSMKIRDSLKTMGLTQPENFLRSSHTFQMIPGGKFKAGNEFYTYNQEVAQEIFDVATKESPEDVNVTIMPVKL
jgi:hypothetical protein